MAEIRIERRRGPSLWPWLIGLVVLALLIWGIAELVNTDRDNQTMAAEDTAGAAGATAAPAASGAPAGAQPGPGAADDSAAPGTDSTGSPADRAAAGPAPLQDLMPLGIQDAGQQVTASGIVVSKADRGGFWLDVGGNAVIWVNDTLKVTPRQTVQGITGTLRPMTPPALSAMMGGTDIQAQAARHPTWQLQTVLYLDTSTGRTALALDTATAGRHAARRVSSGRRRARR